MTAASLDFERFLEFSGEPSTLLLYWVIPKTDRLEAAAAAGLPGRFLFFWNAVTDVPVS
jgi:hypothetical protein